MDWLKRLAGKFVVFDGPDGSGKSTQFKRFAAVCRDAGVRLCEVREPGGTPTGEQIRGVLLNPANGDMSLRCEMLLYMASRAQLMEQVIGPALARGDLVLADRFVSSTLAYQGSAGGLPLEKIMAVARVAIGEHWPDVTVIFDTDEATAAKRMMAEPARRGTPPGMRSTLTAPAGGAHSSLFADRIEQRGLEFQRRVRQGFIQQAQQDPQRYIVIDASAGAETVFAQLMAALEVWAHGQPA